MHEDAARIEKLLRQQTAIAGFGSFALSQRDLLKILTEAARVCAEGLDVSYSKVCRYRAEEDDLLIEAGFGWRDGVIGNVVSRADASSPQGRAFATGAPSICNDLRLDHDFKLPAFYGAHGIVSTIDVVIKGPGKPWGVLEIDSASQHDYDRHDVDFLTGFANVLAEAVATAARSAVLEAIIVQMKALVEQKDRLLDEKNVLVGELQHRVRNNLQLVYAMLSRQLDNTADDGGRRGLMAIARRVSTIAQVYENLIGGEMTKSNDVGDYLRSLCANLDKDRAEGGAMVSLHCDVDAIMLDLDTVTALGIIVAELVANSFEHAFSKGTGSILVSVSRVIDPVGYATLEVQDDGSGFNGITESKQHGLGLIRRLVKQLKGTARVDLLPGTYWTIMFPIPVSAGL